MDQPAETDPVTREAYSREVISAGFWFGDDAFPEPAFYSYTAPEPAGLAAEPLRPAAARWVGQPVPFGRALLLSTATVSVLGFDHQTMDEPAIKLWNDDRHLQ